jgi:ZIP family zinc transporter
LIAVGIGLHNFGEGLAIGGSAVRGEIGLATLLVVGFALHNATEGFGIVAPLAGAAQRPGWGFLLVWV